MNSVQSKLASKGIDEAYRKNKRKSISFLIALAILLLFAIFLSLLAGSYETPISDR